MDLQKFCSTDSIRININKPFSKGEYTYATDGRIMVRVSKIEGIGEQEKSDKFKPVNPEPIFAAVSASVYISLPDIPELKYEKCVKCDGTGEVKVCPECDGYGVVYFNTRYNEYECYCESCGGMGSTTGSDETCSKCFGTGKIYKREWSIVAGQAYDHRFLLLLKDLPNCVIAETKDLKPGHFKFEGGDGLLMPMKI